MVINEVELNPRGQDVGKEWIEIYKPTSSDVNIGNFKVVTTFRSITILPPAGPSPPVANPALQRNPPAQSACAQERPCVSKEK